MYAVDNVSGRSSLYALNAGKKSVASSFSISESMGPDAAQLGENSVAANTPEKVQSGNFRQLTEIDRIIQKELEAEFGIKPWQPGDNLKNQLTQASLFWGSGKVNSGSIDENADKAFAVFQRHLSGFMLNEDIQAEPPIKLNVASDGRVVLQDSHPDREKIESFINENSELRNLYVGVTSAKNLVAIGKESAAFQQRYAVDPKAAVAEFAHLFSGTYQYNTSLKIGADGWQLDTQPSFRLI